MSNEQRRRWTPPKLGPDESFDAIQIRVAPIYWSYAGVNTVIGLFLIAASTWAPDWFGPSWHYFPQLPHNGTGMGICCVALGILQHLALWKYPTAQLLSTLFGVSAFVYWMSGCILAAEGLLGGQGLMEAPFMLVIAMHLLIHSGSLMMYHREAKREGYRPPGEPFLDPPPPVKLDDPDHESLRRP